MATAAKTRGFTLRCPHCGAGGDEQGLAVDLSDVTVFCRGCDEEVERSALVQLRAEADRLLRWLDAAEQA